MAGTFSLSQELRDDRTKRAVIAQSSWPMIVAGAGAP